MGRQGIRFRLAAYTDPAGKWNEEAPNKGNEDNLFVDADLDNAIQGQFLADEVTDLGEAGCLMVVADGMGGMNAGEVASAIAIETVKEAFRLENLTAKVLADAASRTAYLEQVVVDADAAVKRKARADRSCEGMGSTLIMAWLCGRELTVTWCGDSRAYLFREREGIRQISKDHSYVQELVDAGTITPEDAFTHPYGNIVTRSLGDPSKRAEPDSVTVPVCKGDIILVCSDGLSGVLRDRPVQGPDGGWLPGETLEGVIRANRASLTQCRQALWAAAEQAEWYDNVTAVLCEVLDGAPDPDVHKTLDPGQTVPVGPVRRSSWWRALLGAVLALALCAGAWWCWKGGSRPSCLRTDLLVATDIDFGTGGQALIGSSQPRFSWVVPSVGDSTVQTAWRIRLRRVGPSVKPSGETARTAPESGKRNGGKVWDSGWRSGAGSVAQVYDGPDLAPSSDYCWSVQVRVTAADRRERLSRRSVAKRFRTGDGMAAYATPYYPLIEEVTECGKAQEGLFDFGQAAFGKLRLTLHSERDDTATVVIGERLQDGRIERTPPVSSVIYAEMRLPVQAGTHTYIADFPPNARNTGPEAVPVPKEAGVVTPFRYAAVTGAEPVKVERLAYHYPFDGKAASFRCSNDTLNAVWDLCHYSVKACSFLGVWVDGNRERIPYEYDALIAQLCHYGSDAEYSIDRRTLEWLLEKPTWPTEWILYTVELAWNDYLWTGDDRILLTWYDLLKAHGLDALRQPDGLVSTRLGQDPAFLESIRRKAPIRDIVDWPHTGILGLAAGEGGEDDGFVYTDYNAVVNALYYRTLQRLCAIAEVVGNTPDADAFRAEAALTRAAFRTVFLDPEQLVVRDGPGTDHASLHANMMALLCGLLEAEEVPAVAAYVESRGLRCSIFGAHDLLHALYEAGRGDAALRLMTSDGQRSWYNGLRMGTTISLEAWDDSFKPNQDWNHIAGAAPGNAIPFGLMGITPAEPGWARADICPQTGGLAWAEMTLPTIRGPIQVRVADGEMTVTVPPNMTADIRQPAADGRRTRIATVGSGTYRFPCGNP